MGRHESLGLQFPLLHSAVKEGTLNIGAGHSHAKFTVQQEASVLDFKGVSLSGRSKIVHHFWAVGKESLTPSTWVYFHKPCDLPGFINQVCTTGGLKVCKSQFIVDDELVITKEAGSDIWQGYTGDPHYLALPYSKGAGSGVLLQMSIHLPEYQFTTVDFFCAKSEIDALVPQIQPFAPVEFKATIHVNFNTMHGRSFGKEKSSTTWTSHSW